MYLIRFMARAPKGNLFSRRFMSRNKEQYIGPPVFLPGDEEWKTSESRNPMVVRYRAIVEGRVKCNGDLGPGSGLGAVERADILLMLMGRINLERMGEIWGVANLPWMVQARHIELLDRFSYDEFDPSSVRPEEAGVGSPVWEYRELSSWVVSLNARG